MQAKLDEGRRLMESAHAATQLNEQRALDLAEAEASLARREAEAEAALRDAASQMDAAQDIAHRAREQEAEAKVAENQGVADLKAEGDLLGGGGKNFSLDLSGAPGGSLTPILVGAALLAVVAALFWYQARRRR